LGGRKGIRPVKKLEWWGAGVVICLERGVDLHVAQQMPLPLTVSCFRKIQIGLPFCYRLTRVVLDKGPLNVCVCVFWGFYTGHIIAENVKHQSDVCLSHNVQWLGQQCNTSEAHQLIEKKSTQDTCFDVCFDFCEHSLSEVSEAR